MLINFGMNAKKQIARWISIIGHPFTFTVLLVLTASWSLHGSYDAVRTTSIVIAAILVPLGLFIWNRYSSGHWETVDASAPADRPALYTAAFVLLIPLGFYFVVGERASEMVRGFAAVSVLIGIAAALNRWIKLSVHLTIATFAAVIITRLMPSYGCLLLAFLPLLAWSRLTLSRHSISEVLGGFLLGLSVASFTLWL
jgi:membrane-associated phospholipid phosphatase